MRSPAPTTSCTSKARSANAARNQTAVAQKPPGPGLDAAGDDIVWTLTSPELYDLLVTRRG